MRSFFLASLCSLSLVLSASAGTEALTFEELMKFRQITATEISDDGEWVGYVLKPDRGDGEAMVRATRGKKEYRIPMGGSIALTPDGSWAVAKLLLPFAEREKKDDEDKGKPGLALLSTGGGTVSTIERVESHALAESGGWLAYLHHAEEAEEEEEEEPEAAEVEEEEEKRTAGTTLVLRSLESGDEVRIEFVKSYSFDEPSTHLVYTVATEDGVGNGVFARDLANGETIGIHALNKGSYSHLTWAKDATRLAYLAGLAEEEDTTRDVELHLWEPAAPRVLATAADAPDGWDIPASNDLVFSKDGARLFFGFKPKAEEAKAETDAEGDEEEEEDFDPYDTEALLDEIDLNLWHWDDDLIATDIRIGWDESDKNRSYRAVVHLDGGRVVPLADLEMRDVRVPENSRKALGFADVPYLKQITWDGWYDDLYLVDLQSGARALLVERLPFSSSLSPDGRFVVYYDDQQWHLIETATSESWSPTRTLDVSFANEDHDYPSEPGGYGLGGWVGEGDAVLVYDKYDVWQFPTDRSEPLRLTQGREMKTRFRLVQLDPDASYFEPDEELLFEAYDDWNKNDAFYSGRVGSSETKRLREQEKLFSILGKAKTSELILYTEESYVEFPDLWVSDRSFKRPRKISEVNPQISRFAWGTAGLLEWNDLDGEPLQGVVIKPGNYEEGKRYPVLVYFYRFFSQRLHEFNEPVINHRPSFPMYASNGYVVFLPDIRFEVGTPGAAAMKSLVPGVQKLIDIGIADPEGVGLHGHSWSGYTSAYIITQTDLFAACVSGAPVSNMTSAYGGIRWGTGLSRQWQYEKSQSRIGGSLWEYPERYIENSPIFYADRIQTPLLIQHGDVDEAVPWYQSIEFYMAMRRLEKSCVFLQYRDEPHHLKKYPNKLDYSIKMMEFFDHHCKGAPAPAWWTDGVPYDGTE